MILAAALMLAGVGDPAASVLPSAVAEVPAPSMDLLNDISDRWVSCAFDNLPLVLPNDFDPIDVIAAAAVDRCVETEKFRGTARRLWLANGRSAADGEAFYEGMRRVLIRQVTAQIVIARSNAAKDARGIPIPPGAQ